MDIKTLLFKFCDYSLYLKGYSKITIKRYKQAVLFYCLCTGQENIEDIISETIISFFYRGRIDRKWTTNTYLSYFKSLSVFFRWCVKEGVLEVNPLEKLELPKLEKKLPPKLNQQQAQRLLEVAYNYPYENSFDRVRNHAIIATFIYAGLRKGELLKLKLTDVDLQCMSVFIRQGKGNKDRTIPISYSLAQSLNRYLKERKRLNKTCPEFFTSAIKNNAVPEIALKRLVQRLREASQIEFTVHKLRHTFATLMLEGGCDIYSLSRMMGHNDIKTTTLYLHASIEHLKSQINKHPLN